MTETQYVWMAVICIILAALAILGELLWLFLLARRQEQRVVQESEISEKLFYYIDALISAPTQASVQDDLAVLKNYVGDDFVRMNLLAEMLLALLSAQDVEEKVQVAAVRIYSEIKPQQFYYDMLCKGRDYKKAFACQRLAAFGEQQYVPQIRGYIQSKNKELAYNAAMAASRLGDEEGVYLAVEQCEKNYRYSHRIVMELLDQYTGDLEHLAQRLLETIDIYLKATVVKAITKFKFEKLIPLYQTMAGSKDNNIRVAAIRALGEFADPAQEHLLITACHDKSWVVRAAAVRAVGKINSDECREVLTLAVKDEEWWVRYHAANALAASPENIQYVEHVLRGYDRYASDAVKQALYRQYNI